MKSEENLEESLLSPSQSFCRSNSCCQDWWQVPKKGNIFLCSLETCYVDQPGLKLLTLPPPARIKVQLQHTTSELYYCEVCGLEAQFTSQQSFLWTPEGTLVFFQTDSNKCVHELGSCPVSLTLIVSEAFSLSLTTMAVGSHYRPTL